MKVLYLNGADIEGGAARAATRLLAGVHALGVDARLHVQRKSGDNPLVDGPSSLIGKAFGRARPTIEQLVCGITLGKVGGPFCAAYLPDRLSDLVADTAPDIVHLHWVARMMRLETLQNFKVPIVWTMHDSWAFTGGCYLPGDCTRYRESCGQCPVLGSTREDDLSRRIWQRKRLAWNSLDLTLIAPSNWMAECAKASSLFCDKRIEVIHNGIDVKNYSPVEKRTARESLNLPLNNKLILFGAHNFTTDRNKGFHLLVDALKELSRSKLSNSVELVTFGSKGSSSVLELGIKVRDMGIFSDDKALAQLYSAADVFVLPSINESLGYTVMEAMTCGTPCVAFNQGGVPDLIDHLENGYLAAPYEPVDLARGIVRILGDNKIQKAMSIQARKKIESGFASDKIAERHIALYRELLKRE